MGDPRWLRRSLHPDSWANQEEQPRQRPQFLTLMKCPYGAVIHHHSHWIKAEISCRLHVWGLLQQQSPNGPIKRAADGMARYNGTNPWSLQVQKCKIYYPKQDLFALFAVFVAVVEVLQISQQRDKEGTGTIVIKNLMFVPLKPS